MGGEGAGDVAVEPSAAQRLEWIEELLGLFWEDHDSLLWSASSQPGPFMMVGDGSRPPGDPIRFMVNCSDTFYWACADAETIELPGDLEGLRAAYAEFGQDDWPLLWVCRKRGMRPMQLYLKKLYPNDTPLRRALEAAGSAPEPS